MVVKIQGPAEQVSKIYYEYDNESLPLGQGGMGIVYQGYCFQESSREECIPVAIKLITINTHELVQRAMREASIQIEHPNLLRMFGFIPNMEYDAATGNVVPRYYVVMEALMGVNLDNVISGVTIDKFGNNCDYAKELHEMYVHDRNNFVVTVMTNVLGGIYALHEAGYIHRDIDPSNIMVTHDRQIKLIDFGISKTFTSLNGEAHKLTATGAIIGKVDYAAPEIVTGDVMHHNRTTDIYALGIMTYQLYTGVLPFHGDNATILRHQLNDPVPIENISDPIIRDVVRKATMKDQASRYQTVNEFIEDFSNMTDSVVESPIDTSSGDGTVSPPNGITVRILIILLVISAVAGFIGGIIWRLII